MSAAIKLPGTNAAPDDPAYAPISALTEYLSRWTSSAQLEIHGTRWQASGVNLCSVMIDQAGFHHRRLHCIAEFAHFAPQRHTEALAEVRGQPPEQQRELWQQLYKQYGIAMLAALSELRRNVLEERRGVFDERLLREAGKPYFIDEKDLDSLPVIDKSIFYDVMPTPLRLWPLPHLLEFAARGATTADFLDGSGDEATRAKLYESFQSMGCDANDGVVGMVFRYRASTQRLECESNVNLIDLLNCSVEPSERAVSPSNCFLEDDKNNVAVGVAFPDEGYARLRFFRPSVAKNLCFEAAFRYRVHESQAPGLLAEVARSLRQAGFRFQQMHCPAGFERIEHPTTDGTVRRSPIFEEGEIRGLFQLMEQDVLSKRLLERPNGQEIRAHLYHTLMSLQDVNRSVERGRNTLSIFPPEYPRTLAAAARAWAKHALTGAEE